MQLDVFEKYLNNRWFRWTDGLTIGTDIFVITKNLFIYVVNSCSISSNKNRPVKSKKLVFNLSLFFSYKNFKIFFTKINIKIFFFLLTIYSVLLLLLVLFLICNLKLYCIFSRKYYVNKEPVLN